VIGGWTRRRAGGGRGRYAATMPHATVALPVEHDSIAPDGSEVRLLAAADAVSLAHFRLAPGRTSRAVRHRSVTEAWYVIGGEGEFWRSDAAGDSVILLAPGVSFTIDPGMSFQFRSSGSGDLEVVGATAPRWPSDEEAELVDGEWEPVLD
jgi:mannose-6-phosphate isomerase-like protein (cupin superfamily)